MLTVSAGHDAGYYLRNAGTGGVGYYNRGDEPPGVWAGQAAERLGLRGDVDPAQMMALYHQLVTPDGEKLYTGRPPGYARRTDDDKTEADVQAAIEAAGPFLTPGERRSIRAKVKSSAQSSVPFYDMTLSLTKSVSVTWAGFLSAAAKAAREGRDNDAQAFRARARAVTDALRDTAAEMVQMAERSASFVRTGHHSKHTGEWRDAAGLVASIFVQHDNREGEPNLHAHVVILNRGQRADGRDARWRALDGSHFFRMRLGIAAQAERVLAQKLTAQGIRLVQQPSGDGLEVGGINQETLDAFSQRTKTQVDPRLTARIEEFKAQYGREPSRRTVWQWKQQVVVGSRKPKAKTDAATATGEDRLSSWERRAREADVQALEDVHEAIEEFGARVGPAAHLSPVQRARTIRIAANAVQAMHASWTASHLLWEMHRALPVLPADADPVPLLHDMLADALTGRIEGVEPVMLDPSPARVDVDYLGTRASDGESIYQRPNLHKYALVTALDAEEHLLTQAAKARAQLVDDQAAAATVAKTQGLGQEQAVAMKALLTSDKAVMAIRAAAGTGKTRLVGEFAKAWARSTGGRVIVTTLSENASRVAAQEMRQAGADALSFNIARFLGQRRDGTYRDPVPVYERDVIVVDEASQVDTRNLLRLQATADAVGARIILVGDEYQLAPVFAHGISLDEPAGSADVDVEEVQ